MVSLKRLAKEDLLRKLKENHVDVFVFKSKHRRKQPHPSPSLLHSDSSIADSFISSALQERPAQNKNKKNTGKKTHTSGMVDDHNDGRSRRAPKPKKLNAVAVLVDDDDWRPQIRRAPRPKNNDSVAVNVIDDHNDRRLRKASNPKEMVLVPLPAAMFEKITREMKGTGIDEEIVFEKDITASDIKKNQSRLTMTKAYGDRVLTRTKRKGDKQPLDAFLIDPHNNTWRLSFKFWPAIKRYALNGGWNDVVDANVMRPGLDRVQLWFFRGEQDTLCFALNILERSIERQ